METQSTNLDNGNGKSYQQKFNEIETNPLSLSTDYAKQIIQQMNTDLASHFVAYFQMKKQHWVVSGPDWKHISESLDGYAKTILDNAEELAERIDSLGGIPLSNPSSFSEQSYIDFEGNDNYEIGIMLANDLKASQTIIEQLRERINFAKQNEDHGTDDKLKDILEDNEKIVQELNHYLKNQSLERSV